MKHLLGSTFLSIFSLVLTLMLAEIFLWQLSLKGQFIKNHRWIFAPSGKVHGCHKLDEKTIYRPTPNNTTDECWQTDIHGFRITPTLNKKTALNILFMGDSFTFGHGVSDEETYPYFIQKILDEKQLPVRVFNGGVPGYGTDQQIVFFENYVLVDFIPDIVVWNINENDKYDNDQACLFTVENGVLKQHPGYFNTIYLLGSIYQKMPQIIKESKTFLLLFQAIPDRWTIGCSQDTRNNENAQKEKTVLLLQRIQFLSRTYKFKLVFTYIQSQFAYVANPPMWYVNDSQGQLTAIKSVGIEPIVVSDEIRKRTTVQYLDSDVSSTRATENTLGASTNDLSITLFLTADPMQTFGNKHMNANGNKELGLAVYQHLFPTLVSKLSNVH